MLFQTSLASRFGGGGWVERGLLRLAIGPEADLEVLLLFLFTFEADGDLLLPCVLGQFCP